MNNPLKFLFLFVLFSNTLISRESHVQTTLNKYKNFMEESTYVGFDYGTKKPKSRWYTMKMALEHLEKTGGKIVVELGTTRSFVHGGLPGCNSNDVQYWTPNEPKNWDWGAGCFTRVAAECVAPFVKEFHTVDVIKDHIQRSIKITEPFFRFMRYHVCSSLDFLKSCQFKNGIDLLYLDTGDMTPIEPTAQLQLEEAKLIVRRNLIADNGLILIDDVKNLTPTLYGETSGLGKSKYALPYLLKNGFEIVADEYQVILKKSSKSKRK